MSEKKSTHGLPPPIPSAPYRHAAPSGPWPWQSLYDDNDTSSISPTHDPTPGTCEGNYPESLFPNWKRAQVAASKMKEIPKKSGASTIYYIDVKEDGIFMNSDHSSVCTVSNETDFEELTREPTEPRRLRVFCVDNLTVPVLEMLGNKYEIEPFFWTSSVNWIPSRYQENSHDKDDHITITLKFPRVVQLNLTYNQMSRSQLALTGEPLFHLNGRVIDTQSPLPLYNIDKLFLITDFLAIHMLRVEQHSSTMITYHPPSKWCATTAKELHTRISLVGQSVYWRNIFEKSPDPTFVLLSTLWYALYAWDQAFEKLWKYISKLESKAINSNNMELTPELHKIRAHLLHYATLLEEFHESVVFVQETANPAMDSVKSCDSVKLLTKECMNLLIHIKRLKMSREMWDKRLKNAMHLVFSKINIRDSAAMKQISYLTMAFLPPAFVAGVFGMNLREINPDSNGTLSHYFATAVPLTIVSTWVIVAYQWTARPNEQAPAGMMRLLWPVMLVWRLIGRPQDKGSDTTAVNSARTSTV
ncbi:cora-like Mg2+ transporter protein-domain-containing protein [Hysterangium stoloniferum]|nr:cora-like Mg2+ transporter protein-domain-containing protein [Hysterangium stoloniferum]